MSDQTARDGERAPAGKVRRLPGAAMLRRLGWGVGDQAVSSLTNFLVGVYVARTLGAVEFGAFSLAYVTYAFVLNASRGVATDPLVVRHSGPAGPSWRAAVSRSSGTALAVGLIGGALCLLGDALLGGGATGTAFLALGLTLPGLLLQDAWRYAFFAAGRGGHALLNDSVWGLTLLVSLVVLARTGRADVLTMTLAWGLTGTLAGVLGAVQARVLPRPRSCLAWLREHRDLAPRYLAENLSLSGAAQLRLYGVGALAGLTAVGALRGAEMLMGPFFVLMFGLSAVAVPEAVRVLRRSGRLRTFCLGLAGVQAVAAAGWGLMLLLAPDRFGAWLLGEVWPLAVPLIVPATLAVVAASFSVAGSAGLRALAAARRSLRAQLLAASGYLAGGLLGALAGGAVGAAWGSAAGTAFGAAVWWWQLGRGLADHDGVPAPVPAERLLPPLEEDRVTHTPRLSIGLPVHNGEAYLEQSLQALLAQTWTDFELVVSDNASTDRTEEICREHAARDPRIRYVRQPENIGAARNHNAVFGLARGELFKWASHDDLYAPTLVERCVEALDAHPEVVLAHSWQGYVDGEGRLLGTVEYPLRTDSADPVTRFRSHLFGTGGDDFYGVIRSEVLRAVRPHGSHHHADRTFMAQLVLRGPFHQVPEVLYLRRDHPGRAERAAPTIRSRSANLDPVRAGRGHPAARLLAEYVAGYLAVVARAPLTTRQRARCYGYVAAWVGSRAVPGRSRRMEDVLPPVAAPAAGRS